MGGSPKPYAEADAWSGRYERFAFMLDVGGTRPDMTAQRDALEDEIDRLFQSPVEEFVSARNALVSSLRKAGNRDAADRVKAIPKPSVSAAIVNQLYRTARPEFDALIHAGDRVRAAQRQALAGKRADVHDASAAKRDAATALLKRAHEAGLIASPSIQQRVATTLDAIASYGSDHADPPLGRFFKDLDPPGFAALAALAPAGGPRPAARREPATIVKFPAPSRPSHAERAIAQARDAVRDAESKLKIRRQRAERAQAAHTAAVRSVDDAREKVEEAADVLERARSSLKRTEEQARRLREESDAAAKGSKEAEAAHEKAQARLESLK